MFASVFVVLALLASNGLANSLHRSSGLRPKHFRRGNGGGHHGGHHYHNTTVAPAPSATPSAPEDDCGSSNTTMAPAPSATLDTPDDDCDPTTSGAPIPTTTPGTTPGTTPPGPATNSSGSAFKVNVMYKGEDFFSQWDFFTADDPTHGLVNFQNLQDAKNKGLAYVQNGATVLAVDDFSQVPVGGKRDSIRIQSQKTFNSGLFIADFQQMPHGCSVWPAYWSVGPNWPNAGEIDVIEGTNQVTTNQMTLHTSDGCTLSKPDVRATANVLNTKCSSSGGDNSGCAFGDPSTDSYGQNFNNGDGGVFAHLWDSNGIKMWRFSRGAIPADITAQQPDPSAWGTPLADFPSTSCNIEQHFFQHSLVLDTTLCGDFAGATYPSSGCPGTCEQAVADPTNFATAKWNINYIAVYDQ